MHLTSSLAEVTKANTSVMDALPHLAGMFMIMVSLAILWGICVSTAKLVLILRSTLQAAATQSAAVQAAATQSAAAQASPAPIQQAPAIQAPPAQAVAAAPPAPAEPVGIAPDILAVIAAAVAAVTGQQYRIISVKPQSSSWERAGRQAVLSSHRIR